MMQTLRFLWEQNSLESWTVALAVAVATFTVLVMVQRLVRNRLKNMAERTATRFDDLLADVVGATKRVVLLIAAIHIGANQLILDARAEKLVDNALMIALMVQVGLWLSHAALGWLHVKAETSADKNKQGMITHMALVGFMAQFVIWVVVVLSILANLGFDITALIASLGIGGVAVALAVQNILGDLFASMSIALDKPFVAGDSIVVDTISGTVKQVGLKTTRIQADSGEEVVFSNADLLKSRIRNYKRMEERRAVFGFGVSYDTPPEKLRRIPGIVREIVESQPDTRFDRAHFKALGQTSLDFEVAYFMLKPAYSLFAKVQEGINIALLERLAAEGIRFALMSQVTVPTLSNPIPAGEQAAQAQVNLAKTVPELRGKGQGQPMPAN